MSSQNLGTGATSTWMAVMNRARVSGFTAQDHGQEEANQGGEPGDDGGLEEPLSRVPGRLEHGKGSGEEHRVELTGQERPGTHRQGGRGEG